MSGNHFNSFQKKVLNLLLDKYERSLTFIGKNKVNQSFSCTPSAVNKKYADDAEYDNFVEFNDSMNDLCRLGYVQLTKNREKITRIHLNTDALDEIYPALHREKRSDIMNQLKEILHENRTLISHYTNASEDDNDRAGVELQSALLRYIDTSLEEINKNKNVEFFRGNMDEYKDMWKILTDLFTIRDEIYIRNLSMQLFGNSKRLEALKSKAEGVLYKYGDYPEKDLILEEYGIIKTPTYVSVKGPIRVTISGQLIDIGKIEGDLAFSTASLKHLDKIDIQGNRVITVENLTSFHAFSGENNKDVVIYLGGYHNRIKRKFLKKIYENAPDVQYLHYGDIDAGGFYIYKHLRDKTGIPFRTFHMNVETLTRHMDMAIPLTPNDRTRIERLAGLFLTSHDEALMENLPVLQKMLDAGVKLEQEAEIATL